MGISEQQAKEAEAKIIANEFYRSSANKYRCIVCQKEFPDHEGFKKLYYFHLTENGMIFKKHINTNFQCSNCYAKVCEDCINPTHAKANAFEWKVNCPHCGYEYIQR